MRLTVRNKLTYTMGAVLILFMVTGMVTYLQTQIVYKNLKEIIDVKEPASAAIHEMEIKVIGTGMGVLRYIDTGNPEYRIRVEKDKADFMLFYDKYCQLVETRKAKALANRLFVLYQDYYLLGNELMDKKDEQDVLFTAVTESLVEIDHIIDEKIEANINTAGPDGVRKMLEMSQMEADIGEMGTWLGVCLRVPKEEYKERILDEANDVRKKLASLKGLRLTEKEESYLLEIESGFNQTIISIQKLILVNEYFYEKIPVFIGLRERIDRIVDEEIHILTYQDLTQAKEDTYNAVYETEGTIVFMLMLAFVGGIWATVSIVRSILLPIDRFVLATEKIADGDLSTRVEVTSDDEIGKLAVSFNEMAEELFKTTVSKEHLEDLIKQRTQKLEEAQEELISSAIEAGRVQLSAMILHNIGNAITPMKIQIEELVSNKLRDTQQYIEKCYLDLKSHTGNLDQYVGNDPRGMEVFKYMGQLIASLKEADEENNVYKEKIKSAVTYVSEIITLQQAYAASEKEVREMVNLNMIIEDGLQMQNNSLERRGITVTKYLSPGLPKPLVDKNRLMQVVVNLIKNSYEAIDELHNPEKDKKISIKTFSENDYAGFEITDSGIGIDPADIESIFKFGNSGKGSSGMGLYYCKMFVEAHKGRLTFTSEGIGKGATVRVAFKL